MIRFRTGWWAGVFGLFALLATAQGTQTTVTGFLTDTLCGAKGATERHVECAKRTVASGKAEYAIYDEREKRLYILEPQEAAEAPRQAGTPGATQTGSMAFLSLAE